MGCINVKTTRIGSGIKVRTSQVCSVDLQGGYVRVEPEYLWLTESNLYTAIVAVESNRDWHAELENS